MNPKPPASAVRTPRPTMLSRWRVEPRQDVGALWQALVVVMAVLAAAAISTILLLAARVNVAQAYGALLLGAFGSRFALLETLARSSALILTGLAAGLAFRARIWNIGGEGQLMAGGMGAFLAFTLFHELPQPLFLALLLLFAAAGGALLGGLVALLKVRFRIDEIISTVMFNYIMLYLVSYMVSGTGPWREPGSFFPQTVLLPPAARFPLLIPRSSVHLGVAVALGAALLVKVLLDHTPLGFDIRGIGLNPTALRFKGTNVSLIIGIVMLMSGGLAGLAGAGEVFGVQYRLGLNLAHGLGYAGIIVAMLGRMEPIGIVLAAVLFGGLINGAFQLQTTTGVPSAFVDAIQAIALFCVLASFVLSRYQVRRIAFGDADSADRNHR